MFFRTKITGSGIGGTGTGRMARLDVEDMVLGEIENDPSPSTRPSARRTGIGKSTNHDILKKNRFHPLQVTRVQTLQPRHYQARLHFWWQMLKKMEDPQFFNNFLWNLNFHNLHSWELVN